MDDRHRESPFGSRDRADAEVIGPIFCRIAADHDVNDLLNLGVRARIERWGEAHRSLRFESGCHDRCQKEEEV